MSSFMKIRYELHDAVQSWNTSLIQNIIVGITHWTDLIKFVNDSTSTTAAGSLSLAILWIQTLSDPIFRLSSSTLPMMQLILSSLFDAFTKWIVAMVMDFKVKLSSMKWHQTPHICAQRISFHHYNPKHPVKAVLVSSPTIWQNTSFVGKNFFRLFLYYITAFFRQIVQLILRLLENQCLK